MNLQQFLNVAQGKRNKFVSAPEFHMADLYLRVSRRFINWKFVSTIEIGRVMVDEKYQRQGYFKKFLDHIEDHARKNNLVVYIECVHTAYLRDYLVRRGYQALDRNDALIGEVNDYFLSLTVSTIEKE